MSPASLPAIAQSSAAEPTADAPDVTEILITLDDGATEDAQTGPVSQTSEPLFEPLTPAPTEFPLAEQAPVEPWLQTAPEPQSPSADADLTDENVIIVTARPKPPKSDPLQQVNVESFQIIQGVDRAVVGPVALEYKSIVPEPVRDGFRNFISNLGEPVVFLNYLLQLKPGKALETLGRFTINSTVGLAGLVDVAKRPPINLPNRSNGFANTLGYYGVKPGLFLFLPLVGPTTLRDAIGGGLDLFVLPFSIGKPFNQLAFTLPGGIISSLDSRAEYNEQLTKLREESADPYAAVRQFYLQKREAEIEALHGRFPDEIDPVARLDAPEASPTAPTLNYGNVLEGTPVDD